MNPTQLRAALDAAGAPEAAVGPLTTWLSLMLTWNARMDLTAARSIDELVDLMVADAMILAKHVRHGAAVIDIGSGAGAPGLPLALLRPDLRVTLVEPLTKRVAFLRTVIGTLGRTDIALERAKGEQVAESRGRAWDEAISRATLSPASWLDTSLQLAPISWVLLAKEPPPVTPNAKSTLDLRYEWPLGSAARRAVRYEQRFDT